LNQVSSFSATVSALPLYAQVVFNLPLSVEFTYLVADPFLVARLEVGKRVLASFRKRLTSGYLLGWSSVCPPLREEVTLLPLEAVIDEKPLFGRFHLDFYRRAAEYYQTPLGEALFALLPGGLQYRSRRVVGLGDKGLSAVLPRSPVLAAMIMVLREHGPLPVEELADRLALPPDRFMARLSAWSRQGWLCCRQELLPPRVREQFELIYEIVDRSALLNALAVSRMASEKTRQLQAFIEAGGYFSRRRFLAAFAGSAALLRRWQEQGWLQATPVPRLRSLAINDSAPPRSPPGQVVLTPAQAAILEAIRREREHNVFAPFLLHGVTGSGKTEIYIKLIAEVLSRGQDALYLVPEIALTIELVDRLVHEFGPLVAILHSGLTEGERYDQWRQIMAGRARIVVGARSAVFAPLARLGLIVVDEEHEPSYKQESGFAYNGRDLALLRGQMAGCCVVLGSATPALGTYYNARAGRYRLLSLPQRLDDKPLPAVEIVDLNQERAALFTWDGFSPRLLERMAAVFARGRQVMLFLNKRGFSRTLYCLGCGYMPECRLCSVHQTFHKSLNLLVCHYCGGQQPPPEVCPRCGGNRFFPLGLGIQKLEESLRRYFPKQRVLRLDRDATRRKGELGRILEEFRQGQAAVLLGTQMLAKGHNFPLVDLVGVIFADLSLELPEYTAPERTFQLLAQVSGRAGRGRDESSGEVIIQTLQPEHYSVVAAAAHDYSAFYERELRDRRELAFPPFSSLANLKASGPEQDRVRAFLQEAKSMGQEMLSAAGERGIFLMGPVPSAIVKIQNRYRWNLLVKGQKRPQLHHFLRHWRSRLSSAPTLTWRLDIDPLSFF